MRHSIGFLLSFEKLKRESFRKTQNIKSKDLEFLKKLIFNFLSKYLKNTCSLMTINTPI